jgi:exonuclease-1
MGISGLLQFLKEYRTNVSLAKYSGKTVAVDVSCWIHQGAYYADFSEGIESAIQKIIHYVTKRIRMLLDHKVEPIIVFDGASIPVKKRIQEERARIRINSREKIAFLIKEGRPDEANK